MSQAVPARADLTGMVVLVTGAARGQGRAHSEAFTAAELGGPDFVVANAGVSPHPAASPAAKRGGVGYDARQQPERG